MVEETGDPEVPLGTPTLPEGEGFALVDEGETLIDTPPEAVWAVVMDEAALADLIPRAKNMRRTGDTAYAADVSIGVGPLRAVYLVEAELFPLEPPRCLRIVGGADGRFGKSHGEAYVRFEPADGGTRVRYRYAIRIGGPVGRLGGPLLEKVANALIARFFRSLAAAQSEPAGT